MARKGITTELKQDAALRRIRRTEKAAKAPAAPAPAAPAPAPVPAAPAAPARVPLHTLRVGSRFYLPLTATTVREGKVKHHGVGSSSVEVLRTKTRTTKVKDQTGNVVKDAHGNALTEESLIEVWEDTTYSLNTMVVPGAAPKRRAQPAPADAPVIVKEPKGKAAKPAVKIPSGGAPAAVAAPGVTATWPLPVSLSGVLVQRLGKLPKGVKEDHRQTLGTAVRVHLLVADTKALATLLNRVLLECKPGKSYPQLLQRIGAAGVSATFNGTTHEVA